MIKSLTPNLMVADVNKSVEFYREMLGFKLIMSVPETGKLNWAMISSGDALLMFQSVESLEEDIPGLDCEKIGGSLLFYIKVDDIKTLHSNLSGKVRIIKDMEKSFYGALEFTIMDPDGYLLTFAQNV